LAIQFGGVLAPRKNEIPNAHNYEALIAERTVRSMSAGGEKKTRKNVCEGKVVQFKDTRPLEIEIISFHRRPIKNSA
jgi:hypothetical protein